MDTPKRQPEEEATAVGDDEWHHAFNVADTFSIEGRGLVIASDVPLRALPAWLALKVRDPVRLRRPDGTTCRTVVAGIELGGRAINRPFAFLLPAPLTKADVPVGSEVWVSGLSVRAC